MKSSTLNYLLISLFTLSLFVACADQHSNNNNGAPTNIATVPPPANCVNGTAYCNSNQYIGNPGFSAYPNNPYYYTNRYAWNQGGYYGNFCDCPNGSRPVYNGQFGLGCVAISSFQSYTGNAVYWGLGANNNQWVNIPQISNSHGYPQNGCYQQVMQSCFIDQANSCGVGLTCQTTGGASRLGICVGQGATNSSLGGMGGYR
ncbi:MAG TPA: hypothetical protein VIG33_10090 [Pseudobdellovibrionaceae bacterium]|jgi:hypothetical protein